MEKAFGLLYNSNDQLNFLRLLFHGKSDFLLKTGQIMNQNKAIYSELANALNNCSIRKTNWVSEWLQHYFSRWTGIGASELNRRNFETWCSDAKRRNELKRRFIFDFPELAQFLAMVLELYTY